MQNNTIQNLQVVGNTQDYSYELKLETVKLCCSEKEQAQIDATVDSIESQKLTDKLFWQYENVAKYGFNPRVKLKRSQRKKLSSSQFKGVPVSFKGKQMVIANMDIMQENIESIKDQLIPIYYDTSKLPSDWIEDDQLVEDLYTPIEKLDPLGSKKFKGEGAGN